MTDTNDVDDRGPTAPVVPFEGTVTEFLPVGRVKQVNVSHVHVRYTDGDEEDLPVPDATPLIEAHRDRAPRRHFVPGCQPWGLE